MAYYCKHYKLSADWKVSGAVFLIANQSVLEQSKNNLSINTGWARVAVYSVQSMTLYGEFEDIFCSKYITFLLYI